MLDITLDNLGLNGKLQFVDQSVSSDTHGSGVTPGEIHEMFVTALGSIGNQAGHDLHGVGESFYNILPYIESTLGHGNIGYHLLPYIEQLVFHS